RSGPGAPTGARARDSHGSERARRGRTLLLSPTGHLGVSPMPDHTPTIVLVHGAFAESASWNPVIERLRAAAADGGRGAVVAAADAPVVLVGHSYGGMVITEAAAGNDAVAALVYVGAFAPDQGESAFELSSVFPGSTLGDALVAYPVAGGGTELAIRPDL